MNKILIATLILISSGLSHADESSYIINNKEELCDSAGYFAGLAFLAHQKGEEKKGFLEIIKSEEIPSEKKDYFKSLLNGAFSKPIYTSEKEKNDEAVQYKDDTYADCMKKES